MKATNLKNCFNSGGSKIWGELIPMEAQILGK